MIRIDPRTPALHRFLERSRIETLNLAGVLENEPEAEVFVDNEAAPNGVLVRDPWFRYVHSEDEAFLEDLFQAMARTPGTYRFSGVWQSVADRIKARFAPAWDGPCQVYVLPEGGRIQPLARSRARSVELGDAEIIDSHYPFRNAQSLERIRACIRLRPSSAIYVDGRIVSWLLVHEDNSLGIMHTLEKHRRKGYALEVSLDLMARRLAEGKTPFLQIQEQNAMSPDLARKCGLVPCGWCNWFGVVT